MLLLVLLSLLTLTLSHAIPPWTPPSRTDVRSPCPALNTLANHGIIPHSGRGLSIRMLQKALGETYNVGIDLSTAFALGALLTSKDVWSGKFDLSDVRKHNFIEHDASLSREDLALDGDATTFSPEIWSSVMRNYEGMVNTTIEAAARARADRILGAKAMNEKIVFGAKGKLLSYGETALYLSAMGGVGTGVAPVEWIDIWFSQERLPIEEGWTRSENSINGISLNLLVMRLVKATKSESAAVAAVGKEKEKEL